MTAAKRGPCRGSVSVRTTRRALAPATPASLAAGVLLLVAFVRIERRAAAPLVPTHILKRRSVVWGNAAGLIAFVTETSLVFLLTLYLQEVLGYSPLATGLTFGVLGIGTVVGGVLGGRAVGRFGSRRAIVAGGTVQAAATLSLVALGTSGAWIWLLLAATFAVVTARMGGLTGPDAVLSGVCVAVLVNAALVLAGALLAGRFLAAPDRDRAPDQG